MKLEALLTTLDADVQISYERHAIPCWTVHLRTDDGPFVADGETLLEALAKANEKRAK